MKKITVIAAALSILAASIQPVFAENSNPFPPERPPLGSMDFYRNFERFVTTTNAAVRSDGTVIAQTPIYTAELNDDLAGVNTAVDVVTMQDAVFCLLDNGTVFTTPCHKNSYGDDTARHAKMLDVVNSWTDIASLYAGEYHVIGLKTDGTVVSYVFPDKECGQGNVNGWSNVSDILVEHNSTIGITKDGKLLLAGDVSYANELRKLTGVKKIALSGQGTYHGRLYSYIALHSDGTLSVSATEPNRTYSAERLVELLTEAGVGKIKDVYFDEQNIIVLDDKKNMYELNVQYSPSNLPTVPSPPDNVPKQLESNVQKITYYNHDTYYAIDENGQILTNSSNSFSSSDWILTINILLDGEKLTTDVAPYIKDGRTLAPLRAVLEGLGMKVDWNDATKTITATKDSTTIQVSLNSDTAYVNGEAKTIDVPAQITRERSFVPVRFFAEELGMTVNWDSNTRTVEITTK